VNSLPKAVTRQRRDCDLNPGLEVLEVTSSYARHSQSRAQQINKLTSHKRQNMAASKFSFFLFSCVRN